jgi:hypothetical protein
MIAPVARASIEEVEKRVGAFQSKYAGNPLIERIEHEFGPDWSGDPALFLKVILSPGSHDNATLVSLSRELNRDRRSIIHIEDLGLFSYLNYVSQN